MQKKNIYRVPIAILLLLLLVFAAAKTGGLQTAIEKAALFSAGIAMPQGSISVLKQGYEQKFLNEPLQNTVSAPPVVTKPQEESKPPEPEIKPLHITDTPADIAAMIAEAEKKFGGEAHDGKIVERRYDKSNATAVYQNITVRNTTPSHGINIQKALEQPSSFKKTDLSQPTVLIFHTHTTESYEMLDNGWYTKKYVTRSNDGKRNMVRVGDAICEQLESAGIGVIHDTAIHDTSYNGSYDRSRESILKIMRENPSIQVVLDVHRDAIYQSDGTRVKPTASIDSKKAAQIMIIAGCEDGKVASFPHWEQNLTFALQLQRAAETKYAGLMRPILFSARKYNMDVAPCSLLLEMGSDSNTLDEAVYAGRLIGNALAELLKTYNREK